MNRDVARDHCSIKTVFLFPHSGNVALLHVSDLNFTAQPSQWQQPDILFFWIWPTEICVFCPFSLATVCSYLCPGWPWLHDDNAFRGCPESITSSSKCLPAISMCRFRGKYWLFRPSLPLAVGAGQLIITGVRHYRPSINAWGERKLIVRDKHMDHHNFQEQAPRCAPSKGTLTNYSGRRGGHFWFLYFPKFIRWESRGGSFTFVLYLWIKWLAWEWWRCDFFYTLGVGFGSKAGLWSII